LPLAVSGGSFGSGTSPVIAGKRVFLNRDQDRGSSLLAVDLATGKTVWETARPEAYGSFGTPIVWNDDGVEELVMPGAVRLKGYDLKTGAERWVVEGVTAFSCTTPVTGDGLLFFAGWSPGKGDSPWPSWTGFLEQNDKNKDGEVTFDELDAKSRDFMRGFDANHDGKITQADWDLIKEKTAKAENVMLAIKPGGKGDISKSHIAWKYTRGLPYVPSPIYYEGRVYLIKDGGMLSSFEAKTGKDIYLQERLNAIGSYYASPVAADGRIYVASLPGKLTVIKAGGDKPEILHQADFKERIFATPALVNDRLYLRTANHLWAFGK
jgi:outer membrane protein assembly factor BamB